MVRDIFCAPRFRLLNFSLTDAKKSVWVPDGEGGFDEAMIDTVDGDKVNVKVGWEPKTFKSSEVQQVNPPKMEKFDDISNLTYLNEASVLWNLKARYVAKLIYVSPQELQKFI